MKIKVLAVLACVLVSSVAHARPRNRNYYNASPTYSSPAYSYTTNMNTGSDQERCQAEADYMARNNIRGHVWGVIGNFEGVGYGSSPNCNTCTPGSGMTCTGDASARGSNGMWYRVRSWR
jgi:hypothetical protein